ncbi:hypothetical protein PAESOLCIP111_04273 [Paenibacillus solanacearum]|uniref:Uncharacterized protein n=1 Tax=Paenibacillus solanacearum TaxID=2048548 RepID=A0A916K4E4_9BACL|nr:hypothetical protein [Paenibacillus solanacearum]CAG7641826.1 hypothetical protein PAESOLCIP111_04273 [Paenibacillus solanacearum]
MGLMYRIYRAMQERDGRSQASITEFEVEGEEERLRPISLIELLNNPLISAAEAYKRSAANGTNDSGSAQACEQERLLLRSNK